MHNKVQVILTREREKERKDEKERVCVFKVMFSLPLNYDHCAVMLSVILCEIGAI